MAARRSNQPVAGNAFAQVDRDSLVPWEAYQPVARVRESPSIASLAGSQESIIRPRPVHHLASSSRGIFASFRTVTDPLPPKPSTVFPEDEAGKIEPSEKARESRGREDDEHHDTSQTTPCSDVLTPEDSTSMDVTAEVHPAFRASEGISSTTDPVKDSRQTNSTPVQCETLPPTVYIQPPSGSHHKEPRHQKTPSITHARSAAEQVKASRPEALILGNGTMPPTNAGTYGSLWNAQVISPARVPSMSGVFEQADGAEPSPSSFYSNETQQGAPLPPPGQPTFRHQLENGLHAPHMRHGTKTSVSSMRSYVSYSPAGDRDSLPQTPVDFNNPVPPSPGVSRSPETPALLQELFAEIHEQIRSSTNPIKSKLLSNHDDLVDILTRKFDKSVTSTRDAISNMNSQYSALADNLQAMGKTNTGAQERFERQVSSNHEELKTLVAGNSGTLLTQIENLIRTNNDMFAHILLLTRKMDDLELRVEANQCRCPEARIIAGSRNAFASMSPPEPKGHPALMSQTRGPTPAPRPVSPTRALAGRVRSPPPIPDLPRTSGSTANHSRSQSNESGAGWYQQAMMQQDIPENGANGEEGLAYSSN